MTRPWLTLVTITKNDPLGLARTLQSATALREAGANHVVVRAEIPGQSQTAEGIPAKGIHLLNRPANGISDAFNAGLEAATGEWIWFLNGGDQVDRGLAPGFLSTLLGLTRADVIIGGIVYEGEAIARRHPLVHDRWPSLASWIPHPATLVRKRLFDRFGGFDPRYRIAMDYEWWLRVLAKGVAVDVLDVPFAVFASGGISQRPELRGRLAEERNDAIRRHQDILWRSSIRSVFRLIKWWTRAVFSRRQ